MRELLNKINEIILNPIITLLFAIAVLYFFWGLFQFINSEAADGKHEDGKRKIIFGLFGIFVMISAYGIIGFLLNSFGINGPDYLGL